MIIGPAGAGKSDLATARARVRELFVDAEDAGDIDGSDDIAAIDAWPAVEALLTRSRSLLDQMPGSDREEAIALHEQLHLAMEHGRNDEVARLEIDLHDMPRALEPGTREAIVDLGRAQGFTFVALDLAGFSSGSLNKLIGLRRPPGDR